MLRLSLKSKILQCCDWLSEVFLPYIFYAAVDFLIIFSLSIIVVTTEKKQTPTWFISLGAKYWSLEICKPPLIDDDDDDDRSNRGARVSSKMYWEREKRKFEESFNKNVI